MGRRRTNPRLPRTAKWAAICLLVLCAVATVFAFAFPVLLQRGRPAGGLWGISLLNGGALYYREPSVLGMPDRYDLAFVSHMQERTIWWPRITSIPSTRTLIVAMPMWLPALLLAASVALVIWRERVAQAGLCRACGYDLQGLTPGTPCPECGRTPRAATNSA